MKNGAPQGTVVSSAFFEFGQAALTFRRQACSSGSV